MEFYRFLENNPGVFLALREARIRDTIQTAGEISKDRKSAKSNSAS
jgi:hypothetical protein